MNEGIVVYGAGGHGKVVAETLIAWADEWLRFHTHANVALGVGVNVAREQCE